MNNNIIIGIDLGTTYSCVAVYHNNRVEIIPNDQGNRTTPSWVSFDRDSGERLVGESAKSQAATNVENTIYDVKRLMGNKFDNTMIQNEIAHLNYKISNRNNMIEIQTCGKVFSPIEISGYILNKMKQTAEAYLGTTITRAVVTVPAYFNDAQRQATKDAGVIAGLDIVRIINEPTAAALAYGLDKNNNDRHILIYDLGGGTLDVSILNLDNGIFQVLATSGDCHLGGEDIDNKIMIYCMKEFSKRHKLTEDQYIEIMANPRTKARIKSACETAKRILSSAQQATITIDNVYNNIDMNIGITRAKLESICDQEFRKCMEPIQRALTDARLKPEQIDDIVLVGGTTRIPKIKALIRSYFNKDPRNDINPDEAVAYGAAIQAAILGQCYNNIITSNDCNQDTSIIPVAPIIDTKMLELVLIDVIPLSIGIETAGGVMSIMIPRNTPIPCHKEEIYSTYADNQAGVTIKVYEGERSMTRDNNHLGTFDLLGIPPAPRGIPHIRIRLSVDSNGIFNIVGEVESTGKKSQMNISHNKSKITGERMNQMIEDAARYNTQDNNTKARILLINEFQQYVHDITTAVETPYVKSKIGDAEYNRMMTIIARYNNMMDTFDKQDCSIIQQQYDRFKQDIQPYIGKLYN